MKKRINILQVSIGNKVYLAEYFRKAFKKLEIEGTIIGTDSNPYTPGIYATDKYHIVPKRESPDFLGKILDICKSGNINLLMPTSDEDVSLFAKERKQFEDIGVKVLAPKYETADICTDKMKFFEKLREMDIPTAMTWEHPNDSIKFPCIIKPIKGKGAVGVKEILSRNELNNTDLNGMIIQEKLEGTEYTVDYFADFDGNPICIVPRIRMVVQKGESQVALTKKDEKIIELSRKLGTGLGLIGQNTIQCFKKENEEPIFLENNMRFGGGSPLGIEAGCTSPEYILRLIMGEKLLPASSFKENLLMIRYSENIFMDHGNL